MLKNNSEFFETIDSIIQDLSDKGQTGLSKRLHSARFSSTIPGELFGEVESVLREIDKSVSDHLLVKKLLTTLKSL
jgi:hypothetical protein